MTTTFADFIALCGDIRTLKLEAVSFFYKFMLRLVLCMSLIFYLIYWTPANILAFTVYNNCPIVINTCN